MKNVKLNFYKNAIVDDPSHLYNPLTQKITIQNLSNTMVTITFEDEMPSSLTFELVHSNIFLLKNIKESWFLIVKLFILMRILS